MGPDLDYNLYGNIEISEAIPVIQIILAITFQDFQQSYHIQDIRIMHVSRISIHLGNGIYLIHE